MLETIRKITLRTIRAAITPRESVRQTTHSRPYPGVQHTYEKPKEMNEDNSSDEDNIISTIEATTINENSNGNGLENGNGNGNENENGQTKKKKKFNKADHPHHPKGEQPRVKKNDDGTWGPTGLYGGRVKETPLLRALRDAIKPSRLERVEKVLQARCQRVQCLFENLSDPSNGAACLRTMEGLGLLEAHAVEAYEPFHVQGGITMNADKWMVVNKYKHCLDAANGLKKRGFTLIATCLDKDAVSIDEIDYSTMNKICVMFGNEERGLSWALRDAAHIKVFIPMVGFSQSFNISVSCAMMLTHLRERGVIKPDLDDERLTDLYQRWLLMSTKRSTTIVQKKQLAGEAQDYM